MNDGSKIEASGLKERMELWTGCLNKWVDVRIDTAGTGSHQLRQGTCIHVYSSTTPWLWIVLVKTSSDGI